MMSIAGKKLDKSYLICYIVAINCSRSRVVYGSSAGQILSEGHKSG